MQIRDGETGKFISDKCPDPNCGGNLVPDVNHWGDPVYRCDGLTHEDGDSPLVACDYSVPRSSETAQPPVDGD